MKLSNDQVEFRDLFRRFLADRVSQEYLHKRINQGLTTDPTLVNALGELGVFESFDGQDAPFWIEEMGILAEECGRALLPEPIIEQLLATSLIPRLLEPSERLAFEQLTKVTNTTVSMSLTETCQVSQNPKNQDNLSGLVDWVVDLQGSQAAVIFCTTPNGRRACLISLNDKGVNSTEQTSLDLTLRLRRLHLNDVKGVIFGQESSHAIENLIEATVACHLAGVAQAVIEMSCEYVKTRQQFGAPIGSFQAVQHLLAQRYAEVEALSSLSRFAVWSSVNSKDQAGLTARSAVLQASVVATQTCESAIQVHGGIGFTWEYALHLYLRRARLYSAAFAINESRARELVEQVIKSS